MFGAAVNNNLAWFAVIGALNSVVAVYYYARVIKTMIIETSGDTTRLSVSLANCVLVWLMVLPTIGLMLFWSSIEEWTLSSATLLLGG